MKKLFLYLGVMALLIAGAGDLIAGSIDYITNQSAPWIRNFSRNAVNDSADAVNYNPAGTAVMKDGLYLEGNNQTILKTYTQSVDGGEDYESTEPTLFLPSLFAVYKTGSLAAFCAFTVPAGGGTLKYDDGISAIALLGGTSKAELSSMYLAGTLGAAYAFNDMFSLSLAGRYIKADRTAKISDLNLSISIPSIPPININITNGNVDLKQSASGIGGIIGFDVALKDINIGLRYETSTKLDFETNVKEDDSNGLIFTQVNIPPDGESARKDLPAMASCGVDYNITPEMKAGVSFNYFFIEQADQGKDDLYSDDYENGWEAAVGFEYKVMPELLLSIGYMYSKMGSNEDTVSDFEIVLDANSIGCGGKYTITEGLDVTLGLAWAMYTSMENADTRVEYSKDNKMIALGIDYKAL